MNEATLPPLHTFLAGPLPKGVGEVLSRLQRTEGVQQIAVMPDVHLAGEFCVGTVVASDRLLFPNAVGGDIGCGMLALRFDAPQGAAESLADPERAARLLGALAQFCPTRRHHRRSAPTLDTRDWPLEGLSDPHLRAQLESEECRMQLGTLGGGNHFLEFQADEQDGLWLMLHSGSRHLGQCIHQHHLPRTRKLSTNILALEAASPAGREYVRDVEVARHWAAQNRHHLAVAAARAIESVLHLAPRFDTLLDCDHNHLALETQQGGQLFVHRKGATAAHENQAGLIPGSMATVSYHTRGRGYVEALCSSSHGAGRTLSRAQARQAITRRQLRQQLTCAGVWYDPRVEVTLIEESPSAYKPIEAVMRAQSSLTSVTRRLRPLLIHKGA